MRKIIIFLGLLVLGLFLSSARAAVIKATVDPSEIAVGARPLGMGRAFVGLANDVYATFQNPSGLVHLREWQLASMYSNLIQEVDYSMIGFGTSFGQEAFGMSYLKAEVEGGPVTTRDPITDRIVPGSEGAMGYMSSVWFLSYATEAGKYLTFHPVFEKVNLGMSVKLFNQTLTGLPTREVYATGLDFDLGAQYQHNSWMRLGLAVYNALPYAYGGRLVWGSGLTESIPAYAKIGTAVKVIGKGGLREMKFSQTELTVAYDTEIPIGKVRPILHHFGVEWSPWKPLALRLGIDQDISATDPTSNTVDNNLTAGIGLSVFNVRFDYAYHTFGSLPENITHFVSITYGMGEVSVPTFAPGLDYLEVSEPGDKLITFSPYVIVKGKLLKPKDISQVKINQAIADLYPDNSFFSLMKLPEYGSNFLDVKAMSITGRILENNRINAVYLVTFRDIDKDHPLRNILGGLGALGYVSGYKDGTFRPDAGITRAELCALLMKIRPGIEVEAHPKSLFKDVSTRHWAFRYITQAAKQKLVEGYPDGMFRLNNAVTRAETVSILVRFAGLKPPAAISRRPYPDVEADFWAAKIIQIAKENDFFKGVNWKNFDPDKRITRGEVVSILAQVGSIKEKLDELIK